MYKFVSLALAAAAVSAAPVVERATIPPPPSFALAMKVLGKNYALTAAHLSNTTEYILVAQDLDTFPGITSSLVGNSTASSLRFNIIDEGYSAIVPDAGEVDGYSSPIGVSNVGVDSGFSYSAGGELFHTLTSARNIFLACNQDVFGTEMLVLSWGNDQENGTLPDGCFASSLWANCNVGSETIGCPATTTPNPYPTSTPPPYSTSTPSPYPTPTPYSG